MPTTTLVKRDWQKDHVYLITYPRCKAIPQFSPWSLKLETWLRIMQIPYTGISNEFKKFSQKGQVPFIELNGRQVADSNHIVEVLKTEFKKTIDSSDPLEKSRVAAITALLEDKLTPSLFALRLHKKQLPYLLSDDIFGRHLGTGIKKTITKLIMGHKFGGMASCRIAKRRCTANGTILRTVDELDATVKESLDVLSTYLGDRPFFGGSQPATVDCTVFGHIANLIYLKSDFEQYLREKRPNLVNFIERMKDSYWPDWEETCSSMDLNTHQKK